VTNPIPPNPPPGQSAGYPPPGPGSYPQPQGYGPPPAPPEKGRSKALIALLCCIGLPIALVVVVAVVAAVAPKDNKTSTSPSTEAAGQPAAGDDGTSGPGATKDDPVPIGTEVTPAKNWTIKVNTANLDAGAELARANQFNKPRIAGNKLITVNVTIHNGSDKPGMAMTEMKVGALPPSGVKVDQSFAIAGVDTLNPAAQLQPGASVTGTLVFELPVADIPTTVLLAEPQFSLDENEDQRFLAIR
jgi:hypothetical protein